MAHQSIRKNYRILNPDPETWGFNPCFSYYEIVKMLRMGYLSEGTKLEAFDRIYVVVELRKRFYLKKIGR